MQWEQGAELFLDALSSDKPTPGGGAAAAMAGAMGCALLLMSIGTTLKRKSTPESHTVLLKPWQEKLSAYQKELKGLMQEDAQAYASYLAAYRLPATDSSRKEALQQALLTATSVPAKIASHCQAILKAIDDLEPLIAPVILSDVYCARHLLKSGLACGIENVRINLKGITDSEQTEKLQLLLKSLEKGETYGSNPA